MKTVSGALLMLLFTLPVVAQPPMRPPVEAVNACRDKSVNDACNFTAPMGEINGSCLNTPEGKACVPSGKGGMAPPQQGGMVMQGGGRPAGKPPTVDIADHDASAIAVSSKIPDTHQGSCFDDRGVIPCPKPGERWYGQDAQYEGATPSYKDNGDGTVTDKVTSLTWQKGHNDERLNWVDASAACDSLQLGGHNDWRLPTIKELFSITDFRGAVGRRPYLNDIFEIRLPNAAILRNDPFRSTHRIEMMGQTWSSTIYTGLHWDRSGVEAAFFMNFLDGRIKSAPTHGGSELFYRCVRGPAWGGNDFVVKRDGTVTDRASGLMWQQADDGKRRDWGEALNYCEGLTLAGHKDWRLPNIKELQSIVDYSRNDPAIDTKIFRQSDHTGWFWSSTTLGDNVRQANYICFGRCTSVHGVDVHGAGAERSDPKSGNPKQYTSQGGQEDEIRIDNYVRCVR